MFGSNTYIVDVREVIEKFSIHYSTVLITTTWMTI